MSHIKHQKAISTGQTEKQHSTCKTFHRTKPTTSTQSGKFPKQQDSTHPDSPRPILPLPPLPKPHPNPLPPTCAINTLIPSPFPVSFLTDPRLLVISDNCLISYPQPTSATTNFLNLHFHFQLLLFHPPDLGAQGPAPFLPHQQWTPTRASTWSPPSPRASPSPRSGPPPPNGRASTTTRPRTSSSSTRAMTLW